VDEMLDLGVNARMRPRRERKLPDQTTVSANQQQDDGGQMRN
jgi:hypothetical protein